MTLFDFEELTEYWAEHPPLHILLAAYFGAGKRPRKRPSSAPAGAQARAPDLGAVLAELGPGFGAGDVHAGMAPVVLDFAELRHRAATVD